MVARLFVNLADRRLFRGFPQLEAPAGKGPTLVGAIVEPRQQDAASIDHDAVGGNAGVVVGHGIGSLRSSGRNADGRRPSILPS